MTFSTTARRAAWLVVLLGLTACGGGGGGSDAPPTPPAPLAPTITAQPQPVTVVAGQPASFSVSATGDAPLSYEWRRNGMAIAGATMANYSIAATATADDGANFGVVVRNAAGSTTSNAARLTVTAAVAPTIPADQPADQTVTRGQSATFSVAAGGSTPLRYQWQRDGVDIVGAQASSYTLSAPVDGDNGAQFRVRVANAGGEAISRAARLTVNPPLAITAQPANVSVVAGQTATFSVAATGVAPIAYQWRRNDTDLVGATASTYALANASLGDNGARFRVRVSNAQGEVLSNEALLTVTAAPPPPPTITAQPQDVTVREGETANFAVAATGTGLMYQWERNGMALPGANAASYTTPATTLADDGAQFSVRVSNAGGNVTSTAARLTVQARPPQPLQHTLSAGLDFVVALRRDGALVTWGSDSFGQLGGGTPIPGSAARQITGLPSIVAVSAGTGHGLALTASGTFYGWGGNNAGQTGNAGFTVPAPTMPAGFPAYTAISAGVTWSVGLTSQGRVQQWGMTNATPTPDAISGVDDVVAIAGFGLPGGYAVRRDGTVWQWNATTRIASQVPGLDAVVAVAASQFHVLALRSDGTLRALGRNDDGELGNGTTTWATVPVVVGGLTNVTAIAATTGASVALTADGRVWAWGFTLYSPTGNGLGQQVATPRLVAQLTDVVAITAGADFFVARRRDGTLWAWGANNRGQLGDGTTVTRDTPVQVLGVNLN